LAFLCLMLAACEWPAIEYPLTQFRFVNERWRHYVVEVRSTSLAGMFITVNAVA
jgi:hypothetical protein